MTQCEILLSLYEIERYQFLIFGFIAGFLLSMFWVFKVKKEPKFIDFCAEQGIKRLYRIGTYYYTKEDFDKSIRRNLRNARLQDFITAK